MNRQRPSSPAPVCAGALARPPVPAAGYCVPGPIPVAAARAVRLVAAVAAATRWRMHAVAELARACHATGSAGVAVESVLQLAAAVLERRAAALLQPGCGATGGLHWGAA